MKKYISDIIIQYINDYPTQHNDSALAAVIQDNEPDLPIALRTIRWYIGQLRDSTATIQTEFDDAADNIQIDAFEEPDVETDVESTKIVSIPNDPSIKVTADDVLEEMVKKKLRFEPVLNEEGDFIGYYYIDAKKLKYTDKNFIDKLFCAYSRKGLNYSKPQMVEAMELDYQVISNFISIFNITKHCDPLGPFSMTHLDDSERYERIVELSMGLVIQFTSYENATSEAVTRAYKKKLIELSTLENIRDANIASIVSVLPKIEIERHVEHEKQIASQVLTVVIGDFHIGMDTPGYSYKIAKEQAMKIVQQINQVTSESNITSVRLAILGDLPETISGLNHKDSWKTIENGFWGANAITKPFELLLSMALNIKYLTNIDAVGGNHGRLHNDKQVEPSDEGEKLIFYMLDKSLTNIEVNFHAEKTHFTTGNLNYILLHGDQPLDKKSGQEISWSYGDSSKYNMILLGHFHSRGIQRSDDGANFRKMHCPAFCPSGDYARKLGVSSTPGYIMVRESEDGLPMILDMPLFYPDTNE